MSLLGGLNRIKDKICEKLLRDNDRNLNTNVSQSHNISEEYAGCRVIVDTCESDNLCDILRSSRFNSLQLNNAITFDEIVPTTETYEYRPFTKVHGSNDDHIVTKEEYEANKSGD